MKSLFFFAVLFAGIQSVQASPIAGFPVFHEISRFPLGGDGGWDYLTVDSAARRLYIARTNRIMVVNVDTGKLIGEVPETEGAHGIALVPKLGLGFATAGKSGSVTVFNTKDLKIIGHVAVGEKPDAILYDPATDRIFVFNGNSQNASVIEPKTQKVIGTIPLNGKPEFATSDHSGKVFVNLEDKSMVAAIDAKKMTVITQFPLKPCEAPTGISMDTKTHRLIVGCGNKLAVIVDAQSGKVLNSFDVGAGVDATAFDPEQKLAFVSAGEGKLSIIRESTHRGFEHFQDVPTPEGARTLAVDSKSGKIFLAASQFGPDESPAPRQKHPHHAIIPGSFFILVVGQ